jgi:hypothetical protein
MFRRSLIGSLLTLGIAASIATALSARAAGTAGGAPRVVFSSSCEETDPYSTRPNGLELTRLLRPGALRTTESWDMAISGNGRTIAYAAYLSNGAPPIYVSRADGTGLRRLIRDGQFPVLSADGRFLAFQRGYRYRGIWIIGTHGRGLRRVSSGSSSGSGTPIAWSPDSKALLRSGWKRGHSFIILQPVGGKARVLARGDYFARWSPDGHWIAYEQDGLWLIRPDGRQRHRLVRRTRVFAWSPDGSLLAFVGSSRRIGLIGADGRGLRWLHLTTKLDPDTPPAWSPDGRSIAFQDGRAQIWVVGHDLHGPHRLTHDCVNALRGWTREKPVLPPEPPPERVLDANTIATRDPVGSLSADGSRIAFIVPGSPTQCHYIAVWTPGTDSTFRFPEPSPCPYLPLFDVELAGARVAWSRFLTCDAHGICDALLQSATLDSRTPVPLTYGVHDIIEGSFYDRGHGDLFVFNDGQNRLVRIGGGTERCGEVRRTTAQICKTLRRGPHAAPVDSVSGGLIAIRESHDVAVLDAQGTLVRLFTFGTQKVDAARLDGVGLVVVRAGTIERYDVATGALQVSRPMPAGYVLLDVDGGIAVLKNLEKLMLLRLDDGRSRTLTPGRGPRYAELEAPGLYYTYTNGSEGRIAFLPREELF